MLSARGVLLAAESQTGAQPVCDLADNPVATGSIAPILTLYVRDLAGNVMHRLYQRNDRLGAGYCRADERPRLGKLGDRIGPEKSSSWR